MFKKSDKLFLFFAVFSFINQFYHILVQYYKMQIIKNLQEEVVLDCLKKGGLVVFPSDTVYGALVDATNFDAVTKLLSLKNRPPGKPISVFVGDFEMMEKLVILNLRQREIIKKLLPGPYTIVLPSRHRVDKRLESEKGTLGIRIPKFDPVNQLVKSFGKPLTATSANISGRSPCHTIESFLNQLSKKKKAMVDLIVDFGKLPPNKPSTVVDLTQEEVRILRLGNFPFKLSKFYLSYSETETKNIAKNILLDYLKQLNRVKKALVFIIEGELGVGKTIFVKGLGEELAIRNIVSPTFVVYYEYEVKNNKEINKFIHVDLYNIYDKEEFKYLELEKYIKPGVVFAIEWGEKIGEIYEFFKKEGKIVYVRIEYIDKNKRKITIKS